MSKKEIPVLIGSDRPRRHRQEPSKPSPGCLDGVPGTPEPRFLLKINTWNTQQWIQAGRAPMTGGLYQKVEQNTSTVGSSGIFCAQFLNTRAAFSHKVGSLRSRATLKLPLQSLPTSPTSAAFSQIGTMRIFRAGDEKRGERSVRSLRAGRMLGGVQNTWLRAIGKGRSC